ncbi:MAG: ABC transporter permease [Gemmatimonadales bacterium]
MPYSEALRLALQTIWTSKLRAIFTLLGIIVSVAFLVTVVAVIQGMNAYVKENLTGAIIGNNAFQVRRTPISVGLLDDDQIKLIAKRPLISKEDAEVVRLALPDAQGVAIQSGWPTPSTAVISGNQSVGGVLIFGITPDYQLVQDYVIAAGEPLNDIDIRGRRLVTAIGWDVATKLFQSPDAAIGKTVRIARPAVRGEGCLRGEGTDARRLLRRLRAAPAPRLRIGLGTPPHHRDLGEDARGRPDPRRDEPGRGGDAVGAPSCGPPSRTTSRSTRPMRCSPSGRRSRRCSSRWCRPWSASGSWSAAS